ncbi:C45 family autoproteolytic acyltransferase/hydolase [Aurantibacter aestuarii]
MKRNLKISKTSAFLFKITVVFATFMLSSCGVKKSLKHQPDLSSYTTNTVEKTLINDSTFKVNKSFLTKNKFGLYELYVEGNAYQRGLDIGVLTKDLMYTQEKVFFDKIKTLVPSEGKQKFLQKFLHWYNRKIYKHIPNEFKAEIYGVSRYASEDFNGIATPYLRSLYLHGAHDIGHALQDLALVGCTSFAVWDDKTEDGNLLIGRNFDFYAGDDFAKNKMIAFVKPDQGYAFMSVTWGGMIGVVSGMNVEGLTVTINAGKSKIPLVAKTPISILTREILQYASTIEEAIEIAKKREVFVSESILVGSSKSNNAVLIEVSPKNFGVYKVENSSELVCSNHFQSDAYAKDNRNLKTIKESHTAYRYERAEQLLENHDKINPEKAVEILRDTKGLNDKHIGFGNEKALNQLLAHHGIVFQPKDLKVWVSSNPYQLGAFVAYDLHTVFDESFHISNDQNIYNADWVISKDDFVNTEAFRHYEAYRKQERLLEQQLENNTVSATQDFSAFINLNPEYWKAYYLVGLHYYNQKEYAKALSYFETSKTKEVTTLLDEERLEKLIKKSNRKAKK